MITILIVEDEPVLRNQIIADLAREEYSVLEADNAAEAVELAKNHEGNIDLLIVDQRLQTITGQQLAERIREVGFDLKVLQISGVPLEMTEEPVPGRADFLAVPFTRDVFIAKVKAILQFRRGLN